MKEDHDSLSAHDHKVSRVVDRRSDIFNISPSDNSDASDSYEPEEKTSKAPSRKRSAEHITASPYQGKLESAQAAKKLKTGKSQEQQ